MTQEEKVKAYDEALEKAKIEINTKGIGEAVDLCYQLFPQLAESDDEESEDERIRKHIVKFIDEQYPTHGNLKEEKDKMLAYLEKQKERGPLTKDEEYTLHRIIEYLEDETCPSEWINLLHGIYCLPYGKQKESAEKEYVFRPLGGTDITVAAEQAIKRVNKGERLVFAFNGAYIPVIKGYDANEIVDIYNTFVEKRKEPPFVKDVNVGYPGHYFYDGERMHFCGNPAMEDEQKEQKPVPFSCGHENGQPADYVFSKQEYESHPIISTDTTSVKPVEFDGKALLYTADKSYQIGFRDGVASVKPAEWSEEDRRILYNVIAYIGYAAGQRGVTDKCYTEAYSWLKNLPERFNLQPKEEWSEDIIRKAVKEVGLTQHQINWFETNVFPPKQE